MKNYLSLLYWLLADTFRSHRLLASLAISLQLASALFQLGLGAVVVRILRGVETGDDAPVAAPLGMDWLILMSVSIGAFLGIAALLNYFSNHVLMRLQRRSEEHNAVKALTIMKALDAGSYARAPIELSAAQFAKISNAYVRFAAIAQRLLLRTIVPVGTLLVTGSLLVWLDWTMVWLLSAFLVFALFLLRMINVRAVEISNTFENLASQATGAKTSLLRQLDTVPGTVTDDRVNTTIFNGANAKFLDQYERRLLIAGQSTLFTALTGSVFIGALLLTLGYQVGRGVGHWSNLIFIFLLLQFAFRATQSIGSLITSLNRFHGPIEKVRALLTWDLGSTGGNPQPAIELPVAVECQTVHTGGRTIRFGAGNSRFVISGVRIGRLCAYDIFRAIGLSTRPDFPAQFSPAVIAMPVGQNGGAPAAKREARLATAVQAVLANERLRHDGLREKLQDLPTRLQALDDSVWTFVADLLDAAARMQPFVVLDQLGLNKMQPDVVKGLLSCLSQSDVTILAFRTVHPARTWDVQDYVLYDGSSIAAVFTFDELSEKIATIPDLVEQKESSSGKDFVDEEVFDL